MKNAVLAVALALLLPGCGDRGRRPIVPELRVGSSDLAEAVAGLPADTKARIEADGAGFLRLAARLLSTPPDLLALVDKRHGISPIDAVPPDLVPLARTRVHAARSGLSLRAAVIPDLEAMSDAARQAGVDLLVSSSYRSYDYQKQLFEHSVRVEGLEQTERELALPGHSEHQLGTAIDFGSIDSSFAGTAAGRWLASEAWTYGFVMSYPPGGEAETGYIYEPWHFRYVGRPAAEALHRFFGDDRQQFLAFWLDEGAYFRGRAAAAAGSPDVPRYNTR